MITLISYTFVDDDSDEGGGYVPSVSSPKKPTIMSGDDDDDILDALEKWDKGSSNVKQKAQASFSESKVTLSDDDESSIGSDLSIPDIEENVSESKEKLPLTVVKSDSTDADSSQKGGKKKLSISYSSEIRSESATGMSKSPSTLSDKKDDATSKDDAYDSPEKSKKGLI